MGFCPVDGKDGELGMGDKLAVRALLCYTRVLRCALTLVVVVYDCIGAALYCTCLNLVAF